MKRYVCLATVLMWWAAEARAQIVIDGTAEAAYGAALSIQDTRTGYGDGAGNPDVIITGNNLGGGQNGGSEIDQVFATVDGDRLYVAVTGALEPNFNKLLVFIDSAAGGVNQLAGANLPGGLDGFCCGGFVPPKGGNTDNVGGLQNMNGLGFDAGFNADYLLAFTNGPEDLNPDGGAERLDFWAFSAHFADLTQGTAGAVGGLGMQVAPRGEPRVLRGPGDYNKDGIVDAADYTVFRDTLGQMVPVGTGADGNADGMIDIVDYNNWVANFNRDTSISGDGYEPFGNPGNTAALLGPTLPGLKQGELIDRSYALGAGECDDDTGAGCIARELEFALDVDPNEIDEGNPSASNASRHRNFDNFVDLRMALDNSNIAGVFGSPGPDYALVEGEDDPENVFTGVEFSIPLSAINHMGGDIRLMALVVNDSFGHISNQVSGDGVYDNTVEPPLGANIGTAFFGDDPAGSFDFIPGDQFVTIVAPSEGAGALAAVPEPAAFALAIVALLVGSSILPTRRRIS